MNRRQFIQKSAGAAAGALALQCERGDQNKVDIVTRLIRQNDARIPELSRRIDVKLAELQARQLKALDILKKAKLLDHGQFSAEAITLLDEAQLLDPENPDILALHQKISDYTRTIQVPADYATISEALAAARSRDRIQIAAGTYKESIRIEKGVRLEGAVDGKTIIELPAAEASLVTIAPSAEGVHLSHLILRHVGFDLDDDRLSAVIVQGATATINACDISQAAGHGIAVIEGAQVSISGCKVSSCGWDGISVYGKNESQSSRADVRDTTSQNNMNHGLEFWNGGVGSVTNGRMLANGLCGVLAMGSGTEVSIKTSLSSRNRGAGILISDQAKAEVIANRCDKNLLSGFVARGEGTEVSLTACVATGNQEVGILIHQGVKRNAFSGNKANANTKRQVWLDAKLPTR